MWLIAHIDKTITQAYSLDRLHNLLICLTNQFDFQGLSKGFIGPALIRKHLPKRGRIAVSRKKTCMCNHKILIRTAVSLYISS